MCVCVCVCAVVVVTLHGDGTRSDDADDDTSSSDDAVDAENVSSEIKKLLEYFKSLIDRTCHVGRHRGGGGEFPSSDRFLFFKLYKDLLQITPNHIQKSSSAAWTLLLIILLIKISLGRILFE